MSEVVYTVKEACERLGVHRNTLFKWMHRGVNGVRLGFQANGARYRIPQSAIDRFQTETSQRLHERKHTGVKINLAELELYALEIGFQPKVRR